MTRRGWRDGLLIAVSLPLITSPLAGQTQGTLGLGASLVEYDGFLASGALVFAPGLRFDSPRLSFSGQGSWTTFESGRSVVQVATTGAWLAGSSRSWRLELSSAAGASAYSGESTAGHLLGGARLHVFGTSSGGWIGVNSGATFGGQNGVPVDVTVAGWSVRNSLALVGTATTTWQGGVRYFDVLGAVRWTGPTLELELRAGARPWGRSSGNPGAAITEAYGEVSALVSLRRWLSLSVSGGKYPSDPVRRTLGAAYISAGLRLHTLGKTAPTIPLHTTGVLRGRVVPTEEGAPPLEVIGGSDDVRTLRVHAPDASSVELMGDFTDWVPVRLARVGSAPWEIVMAVPAGVHRVNIRLNGGAWSVPGGARVERNEFGGVVGLVVIPD